MAEIGKIWQGEKTVRLDKKDKKILFLLMNDARVTISKISKKVELSKSNVSRRILKFEKIGLISGYNAYIDVSKLGIESHLILIKLKSSQKNKEDFSIKIANIKNVYSVAVIVGEYDLAIGIYSKDEEKRNKVLDEILSNPIVNDFKISKIKTIFPHLNYTGEMFNHSTKKIDSFANSLLEIDKLDENILSALSEKCRISSVELSERLKVPRATLNYRINNLIESGVIAKFQPNINFFMLGVEFYFLRFRLSLPSKTRDLIGYLSETHRANTILKSEGSYQVMAFLQFKDNTEFRKFEEDLLNRFGEAISDYLFGVAKSQYKLNWFPKILSAK